MVRLILYGTEGCHLCETAAGRVREILEELPFTADLIAADIADDDDLAARYGLRIPVLHDPTSGRELDWPFESGELRQYLATLAAESTAANAIATQCKIIRRHS
jgi:hypothetical protein